MKKIILVLMLGMYGCHSSDVCDSPKECVDILCAGPNMHCHNFHMANKGIRTKWEQIKKDSYQSDNWFDLSLPDQK